MDKVATNKLKQEAGKSKGRINETRGQNSGTYQQRDTGGNTGGKHRVASKENMEQTDEDMRENKDCIHRHWLGDEVQVEWGGKNSGRRENHREGGTEKQDPTHMGTVSK